MMQVRNSCVVDAVVWLLAFLDLLAGFPCLATLLPLACERHEFQSP